MEALVLWITENIELIIASIGVTGFGTWLGLSTVNRLFPAIVNTFRNVVILIFEQGFGFTREGAERIIEKLPVVTELETLAKEIKAYNEVKILELEHKLISPIYTEAEKARFKEILDILIAGADTRITNVVTKVIQEAKDKFNAE
jgi:hypothetical protein